MQSNVMRMGRPDEKTNYTFCAPVVAGVFPLQNTIGYASESSGRKIVTIVFDDSFSMANENRYSNANYAIQAFIALLNEEDELHLIYMSDAARQLAAQPGNFDPSAILT